MIQSISVLGCGWLGMPLASYLASNNYQIKGSTTHPEKLKQIEEIGAKAFLLKFTPNLEGTDIKEFLNSDLLIINIPPGVAKHEENYHVNQMKQLVVDLDKSSVKFIIYVSATSVYPESGAVFVEDDVMHESEAENKTLFRAEEIFRHSKNYKTTILRCAGLVGDDRNPIKYFAGKKNLKAGNAPVNLVHREDVIGVIDAVIQNNYWGQTLNISSPVHPLRKDFYPALAKKYNYELPEYDLSDNSSNKIVSISKLGRDLKYSFKFPDPLEFNYK